MAKSAVRHPLQTIVKQAPGKDGIYVDTLECGHKLVRPEHWSNRTRKLEAETRRCTSCPPETKAAKAEKKAAKSAPKKTAKKAVAAKAKNGGTHKEGSKSGNGNGKSATATASATA